MKKSKQLLAFILIVTMVLSCLSITPVSVEAAGKVKLSATTGNVVIGGTKTIKVKNAKKGSKITYKSNKKSVATVSKNGKIKGVKAGTAKITVNVKSGKKTSKLTYKVTVKKPSLKKKTISLGIGKSTTLNFANKPAKAAKAKYSWSSSNSGVATVSSKGKVTGKKAGNATIKVKVSGKKFSYTLSAKVKVNTDADTPSTMPTDTPSTTPTDTPSTTPTDTPSTPTDTPSSTEENSTYYSRGEWVKLLSEKLDFNTSGEIDKENYYFGDTKNDKYGVEAELAQAYGILPISDNDGYEDMEQDVPLFESNKLVTREYATYTVVKALGYIEDEEQSINCSDINDLKYPIEDALGINQGLISLQSGKFEPNGLVTKSMGATIIEQMDYVMKSAEIDVNNPVDEVIYKENVVSENQIGTSDYTLTEDSQGYVVKIAANEVTRTLKKNDVFVLPQNNTQISDIALKINNEPEVDGNYVILKCTKPDLEDVVADVQFSGEGTPVLGQFEASEGIDVEYEEDETTIQSLKKMRLYGVGINAGGTYNPHGKLKLSFDKKISDKGKLKGNIEFSVPSVTCKVDAKVGLTGVDFNELTLSQTDKIKFKGSVEFTAAGYKDYVTHADGTKESVSSSMELGRLPIALGTSGLSIDIILIASYSVKGEVSIGYTMELTHGLQVINGSPRIIHDFTQSFDEIKFKGSAKCGIGIRVVLDAFSLMDLVGMETTAGPAAQVEFVPHLDANLYCGDGRIYLYWDAKLSEETALGKFLKKICHISLEWDIFNEKNSPLTMGVHFENFNLVNSCTYASGKIIGYVKDSYGTPITNARVKIYNGGILKSSLGTDSNGSYTLDKLPEADYTIKVYVTGYSAFESTEHVGRNETKYVETLVMLSRNGQNGAGKVYGDIINAVTGENVDNVDYYIRKNWNNTSGDVVESGTASGKYEVNITPGNYTIQFKATGYIDTEINVAINVDDENYINVALSPELNLPDDGLIRVVLSWGQTPSDLDSHLTGVTLTGDSRYHIYYDDDSYYDENGTLLADLDLDDTTSYGPETVTIHQMTNGIFHYYVHDYSNGGDESSLEMSMSNAQVRVYKGKFLIQKFVVPTNTIGTYWHVFDIDTHGNIVGINTMSNEYIDN